MKLIIAIIQDEDASEVISHLNEAKFQVTRLSTKGGFLRRPGKDRHGSFFRSRQNA